MADSIPMRLLHRSRRKRRRSQSEPRRLRTPLRSALLCDDIDPFGRGSETHVEGAQVRALQVVEKLLTIALKSEGSAAAQSAMERFGSLRGLIAAARRNGNAPKTEASAVIDLVAASCALVEEALAESLEGQSVCPADQNFLQYLRVRIGMQSEERCIAAFIGSGSTMLSAEIVSIGARTATFVSPGALIRRAVELDALGIILAHNHPSGLAQPSRHDVTATHELKRKLSDAEIVLIDHLIVGREDVFSFGQNRQLEY